MSFCTAINCMDGRVQLPVIEYMMNRFHADYVDVISEPGPNAILAQGSDTATMQSIEQRVRISVQKHKSVGIAVVGHFDCTGNSCGDEEQQQQTRAAVRHIHNVFPTVPVIGLWIDKRWTVSDATDDS